MSFTCPFDGAEGATVSILTKAGLRPAIVCPNHGVLAWLGYAPVGELAKDVGGVVGTYVGTGAGLADLEQLPPGGYANAGAGPWAGLWGCRPPAADAAPIVVPTQYATVSKGGSDLSLPFPIRTRAWSGRLAGGVWFPSVEEVL